MRWVHMLMTCYHFICDGWIGGWLATTHPIIYFANACPVHMYSHSRHMPSTLVWSILHDTIVICTQQWCSTTPASQSKLVPDCQLGQMPHFTARSLIPFPPCTVIAHCPHILVHPCPCMSGLCMMHVHAHCLTAMYENIRVFMLECMYVGYNTLRACFVF